MDKYAGKSVINFFDTLKATGTISRSQVLTLESAIGTNLISSSVNMKELTSDPSKSGYSDVFAVVKNTIEVEKLSLNDLITTPEVLRIYREALYNLKNIKTLLTKVSELLSKDKIETLNDSKTTYSFYNDEGEATTNTYDTMEDTSGPRAIIFNGGILTSVSDKSEEDIKEIREKYLPINLTEKYGEDWYKNSVYGLITLLINLEIGSVLRGELVTYTNINGKSYLTLLNGLQERLEHIDYCINLLNSDINYTISNFSYTSSKGFKKELEGVKKFNSIYKEDISTIPTLRIIVKALS